VLVTFLPGADTDAGTPPAVRLRPRRSARPARDRCLRPRALGVGRALDARGGRGERGQARRLDPALAVLAHALSKKWAAFGALMPLSIAFVVTFIVATLWRALA
jgi:hypothetical protein